MANRGKGEISEERKKGDFALHRSDPDEEDDNVKQLGNCSSIYLSLQDCLIEHDRNWKRCQQQVQALKICNDGIKKNAGTGEGKK